MRRLPSFGLLLWILLGFTTFGVSAQNRKQVEKIKVEHADFFKIETKLNRHKLEGNVRMSHENMWLTCDSLYQYPDSNFIEAFGEVHAVNNDTVHLYGNYLFYDGNSKMSKVRGDVRLEDPSMTLTTHYLDYDGAFEVAYYYEGGTLSDTTMVLTSERGNYITSTQLAYFREKVKVTSDSYVITSDTMRYSASNTQVGLLGPSTIVTLDSVPTKIYTHDGWFDTSRGMAELYSKNRIETGGYTIWGDTVRVDTATHLAVMRQNVVLDDTVNNVIICGDYAKILKDTKEAYIADRALMVMVGEGDSLFMHADTLHFVQDTAEQMTLYAYRGVRMFNRDLQALCDSMVYATADSLITLLLTPVTWAGGNQMTGGTISMKTNGSDIEHFDIKEKAMLVTRRDSSEMFDQVKGRDMTGFFRDNEIYMLQVDGNGETIYYPDDGGSVIGANTASASSIRIMISERRITDIFFMKSPSGELNPLFMVDPVASRLAGFQWLEESQPKSKRDVLKGEKMPDYTRVNALRKERARAQETVQSAKPRKRKSPQESL